MDEHPSWELEEGDEIVPGRHAVRKLGGGYDYEAYLAWDDHLLALVVAKLLRPHLLGDAHAIRSFKREAETLRRLDHPVVVRGYGAVMSGPRPHLVIEHLEGPPLSSLIRKYGSLALEQLIPLTLQICSAIHYMAAEKMVHLDVKPRNIIMGGPPRLIDMSLARDFLSARQISGPVGTDAYMAPEQCAAKKGTIGPPADVWGLGATLFHAVARHVPFPRVSDYDREDPRQRFPQLYEDHAPYPDDTPQEVIDVIESCLQKDPAERPTAREVALSLESLVTKLPERRVLSKLRPRLRSR